MQLLALVGQLLLLLLSLVCWLVVGFCHLFLSLLFIMYAVVAALLAIVGCCFCCLLSLAVVAIAVVGLCCCSSVATACLITLFGSCSGYAGKTVIVKIVAYHMEYFFVI